MNLGCFKFHRTYSNSVSLSNGCDVSISWTLKECIQVHKRKKYRCLMFTSSIKREIRTFHFAVVQLRQRNVQKMRDACAKFLFCQSRLIFCLHDLKSGCLRKNRWYNYKMEGAESRSVLGKDLFLTEIECESKDNVRRDDSQRRFLAQRSVATL